MPKTVTITFSPFYMLKDGLAFMFKLSKTTPWRRKHVEVKLYCRRPRNSLNVSEPSKWNASVLHGKLFARAFSPCLQN